MFKSIGLIQRRADFSWDDFSLYWRTTHRAEAEKLEAWLRRYRQNHLAPDALDGFCGARPADGCPILWLESAESIAEMVASAAFRKGAYLDEPRFMDGRSLGLVVVQEHGRAPLAGATGIAKWLLFARRRTSLTADAFRSAVQQGVSLLAPAARPVGLIHNWLADQPDLPAYLHYDLVEELWLDADSGTQPGLTPALASLVDTDLSYACSVREIPVFDSF